MAGTLTRLGYATDIVPADDAARVLEQGLFTMAAAARVAAAPGKESLYQRLTRSSPEARRKIFVILAGDEFKTGDGMQAWAVLADLVLSAKDAGMADNAIRTVMAERDPALPGLHRVQAALRGVVPGREVAAPGRSPDAPTSSPVKRHREDRSSSPCLPDAPVVEALGMLPMLSAWPLICAAFLVVWSWVRLLVSGHARRTSGRSVFPLIGSVPRGSWPPSSSPCGRICGRVAPAAAGASGSRESAPAALGLVLLAGAMLPLLSGDLFSVLAYPSSSAYPSSIPSRCPLPASPAPASSRAQPALREAPAPTVRSSWSLGSRRPVRCQPAAALPSPSCSPSQRWRERSSCYTVIARGRRPWTSGLRSRGPPPVIWIRGRSGPQRRVGGPPPRSLARRRPPFACRARLRAARGGGGSKLTAVLPAVMYLAYLAGRPGRVPVRLVAWPPGERARARRRARLCALLSGLDTLRVPLAFLRNAGRQQPRGDRLRGPASDAGSRRRDHASPRSARCSPPDSRSSGAPWPGGPPVAPLAGSMAAVSLLAMTLAAPVFHAWYPIPALVLSVELRDPAWQAWLLRFGALSVLADGSVLFAYGSSSRAVYTALSVPLSPLPASTASAPAYPSARSSPSPPHAAVLPLIGWSQYGATKKAPDWFGRRKPSALGIAYRLPGHLRDSTPAGRPRGGSCPPCSRAPCGAR